MSESFAIFEVRKQIISSTSNDMAKVVYKSYNQNDSLLFPYCIGDFIPENDPVRVLDAIVEHLDISAIEATYKGGGASSFAPRMLLKVVLYAYLQNVYAGRKMEKLLKRDVNFMWLSGMQRPDYNTINLFRKNRLADVMDDIFIQVVQMLVDAKFISLEVQYIDGTKIEANANKYTFVWKKATKTNQGRLIPFLDSFTNRYGHQSSTICADSGYGSERNYEYMLANLINPYVKYNMFHAEDKRKRKNNPFLVENMFYNKEQNFYVCPRGQHLDFVKEVKEKSDLGYESSKSVYRAKDCSNCPLRGMCYKGKADRRTIEVNHRNNELHSMAKELLTSEEGLRHRSQRPIEPEAVFGQIKYDNGFKRFRYRGERLVKAEFATVAVAHNIRKMISNGYDAVIELR